MLCYAACGLSHAQAHAALHSHARQCLCDMCAHNVCASCTQSSVITQVCFTGRQEVVLTAFGQHRDGRGHKQTSPFQLNQVYSWQMPRHGLCPVKCRRAVPEVTCMCKCLACRFLVSFSAARGPKAKGDHGKGATRMSPLLRSLLCWVCACVCGMRARATCLCHKSVHIPLGWLIRPASMFFSLHACLCQIQPVNNAVVQA